MILNDSQCFFLIYYYKSHSRDFRSYHLPHKFGPLNKENGQGLVNQPSPTIIIHHYIMRNQINVN
jgi:hypothetical protein